MPVKVVDPAGERAARVRRILGRALRQAIETHGSDLAGFALVSWDMRGECSSSMMTAHGMVGQSLAPAFVHDALNRHVAVDIACRTSVTDILGDA